MPFQSLSSSSLLTRDIQINFKLLYSKFSFLTISSADFLLKNTSRLIIIKDINPLKQKQTSIYLLYQLQNLLLCATYFYFSSKSPIDFASFLIRSFINLNVPNTRTSNSTFWVPHKM